LTAVAWQHPLRSAVQINRSLFVGRELGVAVGSSSERRARWRSAGLGSTSPQSVTAISSLSARTPQVQFMGWLESVVM